MIAAIAWIGSLLGFGVLYVVLLANAMNTVPVRLTLGVAIGLAMLPSIALVAGVVGFYKSFSAQAYARAVLIYALPLLMSAASAVIITRELNPMWLQWLRGGGQPYVQAYQSDGHEPFYALEIRPAQDDPAPGLTRMTGDRVAEPVFVAEEVLFTSADVAETWVEGPGPFQGFVIGIAFTAAAQPRVEASSRRHVGQRWAILLNGELFAAPSIVEPFRENVVLQGGFNEMAAQNFARGIMQQY